MNEIEAKLDDWEDQLSFLLDSVDNSIIANEENDFSKRLVVLGELRQEMMGMSGEVKLVHLDGRFGAKVEKIDLLIKKIGSALEEALVNLRERLSLLEARKNAITAYMKK